MTRFRIVKDDGEYQVVVIEDGRRNEARTYYTDDREDAELTMQAMIEEE